MQLIRATLRFLFFIVFALWLILYVSVGSLFVKMDTARLLLIRQKWTRQLFRVVGVKVSHVGNPPHFPCILMSNHRTYLDPAVIVCNVPGYPVSKAEVAKWPIIGYGVKITGILFLQRDNAASRKDTLQGIADKVQEGFPVILFPEGTTHAQPTTIDYKLGGFKLAAANAIPIVPVAIDYRSPEDYWTGDDQFLPHFFRRFGVGVMQVEVHYGAPLYGDDAEKLMRAAKNWTDGELRKIRTGFNT